MEILKETQEQVEIKYLIEAQVGSMKEIWDNEADEACCEESNLFADKNEPLLDLEAR